MRVRLTDIRDHSVRELDLTLESRDMPGWQSGISGWSIGRSGSGAPIEIDEPLGDCHVGVFTISFQVLIWGFAKQLPEIWTFPQERSTGKLVPFEPERWLLVEREELRRVAMGGDVKLRFDQSPLRFGNYILENLSPFDSNREHCAFCNGVLRSYFRVGNQQVCPDCTEKFKQETRATRDRNYRRALRDGILAAAAGGVIHWLLLSTVQMSFGSILIGALVGMAMRRASRESADTRHQLTAAALTLAAGAQPWWRGAGSVMAAISLAIGLFAAWRLPARDVRTEIHGPYNAR